ncbi:hypothetical protein [uncultured Alteromonas sp.]|jgi:hypothetical protein|uniref:hypothetical protein n=1 Tax=uncultured Alteromonas sp. TaxID=179113 RepID=UPI0025EBD95D|nr:hypothetical protein [uncultured Alteromonas sp.]|tara:strand:+ start:2612 stop:2965 length:354 start_codon:yes stop_codon:yes gene_type:complete
MMNLTISTKGISTFFFAAGFLLFVQAFYVSSMTTGTSDYLFNLHDIQNEQYTRLGLKQSKVVLRSEVIREVTERFTSHNFHAVVAMSIAGVIFLLLGLLLSRYHVNISELPANERKP